MNTKSQNGIVHLGIILAVVILAAVGFVGWRVMSASKEKTPASQASPSAPSDQPQTAPLKFSQPIFNPADISHIGPLGELNGGYDEAQTIGGVLLNIKAAALSGGKEIEVHAPTNMTLERYAYYQVGSEPNSWTLIFRLSADVTMKMDHISRASDKIVAGTTSAPKSDSRDEMPKSKVSFEAGEVIAYTSGTSLAHNWNIYMYDSRHQNQFINQARYKNDQAGQGLLNAVCPFDYYDETQKSAFMALMGQTKAGQSSTCGEVSRDSAGTLSGMWHFSSDASSGMKVDRDGKYDSPISIYKNAADVITIHQIDGKRIDVNPGSKTHKDPAGVTSEHCYEGIDSSQRRAGYAFFKLSGTNQMSLAYSPSGSCPASFPSQGAKIYYR